MWGIVDFRWVSRTVRFLRYPVFLRILGSVVFFAVYSILSMAFEQQLLGEDLQFPQGVHTLLGVSLSALIVFRTNSSYDRWWEGRKLLGSLVNRSRALAALVWSQTHLSEASRQQFLKELGQFSFRLRDHLRGPQPPPDHLPQRTLLALGQQLAAWEREGGLPTHTFSSIERQLSELYDILGGCERIRNTPVPLSHRAVVPQVVVVYLLALPWGLPNGKLAVLIVALVAYFLVSLEMIAEEIEEPFGQEPDDLPLTRTCLGIEQALLRVRQEPPTLEPVEA